MTKQCDERMQEWRACCRASLLEHIESFSCVFAPACIPLARPIRCCFETIKNVFSSKCKLLESDKKLWRSADPTNCGRSPSNCLYLLKAASQQQFIAEQTSLWLRIGCKTRRLANSRTISRAGICLSPLQETHSESQQRQHNRSNSNTSNRMDVPLSKALSQAPSSSCFSKHMPLNSAFLGMNA